MADRSLHEAAGLLAVVAGLIFVGVELRQTNNLAQAAAYQAIGLSTAEGWSTIAENPDLNRLNHQAESPAALANWTGEDWARYGAFMTGWARRAETALLQVEQGLRPEESMEHLGYSGLSGWLDVAASACVWPRIRQTVGPSFRAVVEGGRTAIPECPVDVPALVF